MTDANSLQSKKDQEISFQIQLDWLTDKRGLLSAADVDETIQVATPTQFGGEGSEWSPEHLFLASISSCYMTTYLVFAKKYKFSLAGFSCKAAGQIGLVSGRYQFTTIHLFVKIYVADEALVETAKKACQKTQEYCLISHSVSATLVYHPEVTTVEKPAALRTEGEKDFKPNISSHIESTSE